MAQAVHQERCWRSDSTNHRSEKPVAIVIGASPGIGKEAALRFAGGPLSRVENTGLGSKRRAR